MRDLKKCVIKENLARLQGKRLQILDKSEPCPSENSNDLQHFLKSKRNLNCKQDFDFLLQIPDIWSLDSPEGFQILDEIIRVAFGFVDDVVIRSALVEIGKDRDSFGRFHEKSRNREENSSVYADQWITEEDTCEYLEDCEEASANLDRAVSELDDILVYDQESDERELELEDSDEVVFSRDTGNSSRSSISIGNKPSLKLTSKFHSLDEFSLKFTRNLLNDWRNPLKRVFTRIKSEDCYSRDPGSQTGETDFEYIQSSSSQKDFSEDRDLFGGFPECARKSCDISVPDAQEIAQINAQYKHESEAHIAGEVSRNIDQAFHCDCSQITSGLNCTSNVLQISNTRNNVKSSSDATVPQSIGSQSASNDHLDQDYLVAPKHNEHSNDLSSSRWADGAMSNTSGNHDNVLLGEEVNQTENNDPANDR